MDAESFWLLFEESPDNSDQEGLNNSMGFDFTRGFNLKSLFKRITFGFSSFIFNRNSIQLFLCKILLCQHIWPPKRFESNGERKETFSTFQLLLTSLSPFKPFLSNFLLSSHFSPTSSFPPSGQFLPFPL